jgi:hypothetical protein
MKRVSSFLLLSSLALLFSVPLTAQSTMFQSQNLSSGLVGWWRLCGDSSATSGCNASASTAIYDSSGNGSNGTWHGTQSGTTGWYSAGKVGPWSGTFDSTDNYVDLGQPSVLALTNAMTVTAWVDLPSAAGQVMFLGLTGSYTYFSLNGAGTIYVYLTTSGMPSGSQVSHACSSWNSNGWNFLAMTYSSSSGYLSLYCNGGNAWQVSYGGTLTVPGTYDYTIGARHGGTSPLFSGQINDVRIYNRALSQPELAKMYLAHN